MRITLAILFLFFVSTANAELVTYTASDNPSSNPDGNSNTVDVWTTSFTSGDSIKNGSFFLGDSNWALYANDSNTADMRADVSALLPLANRDLGIAGDSFSLDFTNGNIDTGGAVGVELLDENGNRRMEFGNLGTNTNYYLTDAGGAFVDSGVGFTNAALTLELTLDNTSGNYTLEVGGQTFNRAFLNGGSSIAQIRVFNFNAGNNNNVLGNNLTLSAVPEPTTML